MGVGKGKALFSPSETVKFQEYAFPIDYFFYVFASLGFIVGRVALGTLGKLCITTSYGAVDLLAAELYPTVAR